MMYIELVGLDLDMTGLVWVHLVLLALLSSGLVLGSSDLGSSAIIWSWHRSGLGNNTANVTVLI